MTVMPSPSPALLMETLAEVLPLQAPGAQRRRVARRGQRWQWPAGPGLRRARTPPQLRTWSIASWQHFATGCKDLCHYQTQILQVPGTSSMLPSLGQPSALAAGSTPSWIRTCLCPGGKANFGAVVKQSTLALRNQLGSSLSVEGSKARKLRGNQVSEQGPTSLIHLGINKWNLAYIVIL